MFKIGNYASDDNGRIVVISSSDMQKLNPIIITEEILSEFGFEQTEASWGNSSIKFDDWSNGNFGVHPISGIVEWQVSFNNKMTIILIKYLHELQNTYLELTGNELKYRLSI